MVFLLLTRLIKVLSQAEKSTTKPFSPVSNSEPNHLHSQALGPLKPLEHPVAQLWRESWVVYSLGLRFWSVGLAINLNPSPLSFPPFPKSTKSLSLVFYLKMRVKSKNTYIILNSSWHFFHDPYTLSSTLPLLNPSLFSFLPWDTKSPVLSFYLQMRWRKTAFLFIVQPFLPPPTPLPNLSAPPPSPLWVQILLLLSFKSQKFGETKQIQTKAKLISFAFSSLSTLGNFL